MSAAHHHAVLAGSEEAIRIPLASSYQLAVSNSRNQPGDHTIFYDYFTVLCEGIDVTAQLLGDRDFNQYTPTSPAGFAYAPNGLGSAWGFTANAGICILGSAFYPPYPPIPSSPSPQNTANYAFIQSQADTALYQVLTKLVPGKHYRIGFYAAARFAGYALTGHLTLAGVDLVSVTPDQGSFVAVLTPPFIVL